MIYPERRVVTEQTVRSWAADRATDIERDARGDHHPMDDAEAEEFWRAYFHTATLEEAIELLEDEGVATFTHIKED